VLTLTDGGAALAHFRTALQAFSTAVFGIAAAVWERIPPDAQEEEYGDKPASTSHLPTGLLNYVDGAVMVVDSTYRVQHYNSQVHAFFPDLHTTARRDRYQ